MKLLLLFALLLTGVASRANDSSFTGVGGSARPTQGENAAIRMVSEKVVVTANADTYSTRAEFVFRNDTARAQTVQMGFPEDNWDEDEETRSKTGFINFRTSVDDQNVVARRTILKKSDAGFNIYWIKTVSFAPHQTRLVRVEFASPYGGSTNWGFTGALAYAFTGGNWRGKVSESVLEVRLTQPGLWRAVAVNDDGKPLAFTLTGSSKGAVFRRVWKNWEAQEYVTFGLERVQSFWRLDSGGPDNGEFTLQNVAASQTVRVGAKPKTLETSEGFPAMGFTRDGIFYVEAAHLVDRFDVWGATQQPVRHSRLDFNARNAFVLSAGRTRIEGKVGQSALRVNGQTVALGAPILLVPHDDSRMLYLPLAPVARALGLKISLEGERLFRLERGSWRG